MATWYVINDMQVGTTKRYAGELVNDAVIATAPMIAAGIVLWPASDPIVAAAALAAQALKKRGQSFPNQQATSLMIAAVAASLGGTTALAGGTPGAGQLAGTVQKSTVTVTAASFNATTVNQTIAIGSPLPNNARVLGHEIRVLQPFVGASISSVALTVGSAGFKGSSPLGSTGTAIMFQTNNEIVAVQAVTATGSYAGTAGVDPQALYSPSGVVLNALFMISGYSGAGQATPGTTGMTGGLAQIDVLWTALP